MQICISCFCVHKNFSIIKALGWISGYWNRAEISSISYQDLKCGLLKNAFIKSDLLFNLQYSSLVSLQHKELQGLLAPACCYSGGFNRETTFTCSKQHASIDHAWGWELAVPQLRFCWWYCLRRVAQLFWIFLVANIRFHIPIFVTKKDSVWVMLVLLNLFSNQNM